VSFHKGMARMNFADGSGSVMLQNFTLADGQICVRAVFTWADTAEAGTYSIFPRDSFDWTVAADQIAAAWLAGKPKPVATVSSSAEASGSSKEPAVAAG
jgi:hypothetical protein